LEFVFSYISLLSDLIIRKVQIVTQSNSIFLFLGWTGAVWQSLASPASPRSVIPPRQVHPCQGYHWQSAEPKSWSCSRDGWRHKRWTSTKEGRCRVCNGRHRVFYFSFSLSSSTWKCCV